MKYLESLIAAIFFTMYCIAQQSDFSEGFYVNHHNDTVKGFLAVGKNAAAGSFRFKPTAGSATATTISLDSCREFSSGNDYYISWFGKRTATYIDKFDFTIKNQDSFVKALIPLKLLYRGSPLSLFYFRDNVDHFFVQSAGKTEELVIAYRYLTNWEKSNYVFNLPAYYTMAFYRDQIEQMMSNLLTKKQKNIIENAAYERRELITMFRAIDYSGEK